MLELRKNQGMHANMSLLLRVQDAWFGDSNNRGLVLKRERPSYHICVRAGGVIPAPGASWVQHVRMKAGRGVDVLGNSTWWLRSKTAVH